MIHYIVNTGDTRHEPWESVGPDAIELFGPLVRAGGGALPDPYSAFRVQIDREDGGALFSLSRARELILAAGVAWTADGAAKVWHYIEETYRIFAHKIPELMESEAPVVMPDSLPWLSVLCLPGMLFQSEADRSWFGAFESCLAWVILREAGV